MALTSEILKANEALAGLEEAQLQAIETLSTNDEKSVISTKIGEYHQKTEEDVKGVSGMDKNEGEKSHEYLKRVLGGFKESSTAGETLKADIAKKETTILTLQKQIKEGSTDKALKQQLDDAQTKLTSMQTTYDTDKTSWEKKYSDKEAEVVSNRVKSQFTEASKNLKFKGAIPESIQKTLISDAVRRVTETNKAEFVDSNGVQTLVFRDSTGKILVNTANLSNPFTAEEMLRAHLKDGLEELKGKGGGTGGDKGKGAAGSVDVSHAKTQNEAETIITNLLMKQGLTRGSEEFADAKTKIWKDNGIDKLEMV
jgi:hypothetical protein